MPQKYYTILINSYVTSVTNILKPRAYNRVYLGVGLRVPFGKGRSVSPDCFPLLLGAMKTPRRAGLGSPSQQSSTPQRWERGATADIFQLDQSPAQQHFPKPKKFTSINSKYT